MDTHPGGTVRKTKQQRFTLLVGGATAILALAVAIPTHADLNTSPFNAANGETWNDPGNGYYDPAFTDWEDLKATVLSSSDITSRSLDDAFGQGTKEDNPVVTVTDGSIPPNKSDLIRFYVASERVSNGSAYAHTYLYLAWARTNVLGSANMDFELNQLGQDLSTPGTTALQRTAGDVLVTYDFEKGGNYPVIAALFWVTTGSASQCYASNRVPCWGNRQILLRGGDQYESEYAEAAINQTPFYDNVLTTNDQGSPDGTLRPALTFGELAIDLSLVMPNAFGPDLAKCSGLSSIFLKSRSSSSFTAELKDFIAPHAVQFSNCGAVKVTKSGKSAAATGGTALLAGAQFTLTRDADGVVVDTRTTGTDGTLCFDNVLLGTDHAYTVTEIAAPTGYSDGTAQAVTVVPGTTCTGTGENAPAAVAFVDDPLTTITVSTQSLAGSGVTVSSVQCVNASPTGGTDTGESAAVATPHTTVSLKPGTYTCTVVIDP